MVEFCVAYQASVGSVEVRETPQDVFEHVSKDFKELVGGRY